MKILVLNGSPKKNSDTMHITEAFLEGMNEKIETEVKIIHVIEKQIAPCYGCFGCWQGKNSVCVQEDDMSEILSEMQAADLVIWSFPLYCYGMPSHLKAVCDRTIPLVKLNMRMENGRVVHEPKEGSRFAKHIMLCGCGFPSFKGNFEPMKMQFANMFGEDAFELCISEAPLLSIPEAKEITEPLLEYLRVAGAQYAKKGALSILTRADAERPMLSTETYLEMINGLS